MSTSSRSSSRIFWLTLGYIAFLCILAFGVLALAGSDHKSGGEVAPIAAQEMTQAPGLQVTPTHTPFVPQLALTSESEPTPTQPNTPIPAATEEQAIVFAVIGDYGSGNQRAESVAELVKGWQPDFIITTGDNNYPYGSEGTIDVAIGQFYHEFIFPYQGSYGQGAEKNRFFPTLGNHDWMTARAQPYLDYFSLPGNERYYDFTWGSVHFFALDSDSNEPDGVGRSSDQAAWLQDRLATSSAHWKIVYMHHPPYSSGIHGPVDWMRWPFADWGATVVISGHDHVYERLIVDDLPYFINGLGGGAIYDFTYKMDGSMARYNDDYGAIRVMATSKAIRFEFITRGGDVIDTYEISQ